MFLCAIITQYGFLDWHPWPDFLFHADAARLAWLADLSCFFSRAPFITGSPRLGLSSPFAHPALCLYTTFPYLVLFFFHIIADYCGFRAKRGSVSVGSQMAYCVFQRYDSPVNLTSLALLFLRLSILLFLLSRWTLCLVLLTGIGNNGGLSVVESVSKQG